MKNRRSSQRASRITLSAAILSLVLTVCAPTFAELPAVPSATGEVQEGRRVAIETAALPRDAESLTLAPLALPTQTPAPPPGHAPPPPPPPPPPSSPVPNATFAPVVAQQAKIRLDGADTARDVVADVVAMEGVAFATAITVGQTPMNGPNGPEMVRVAGVHPEAFRVLTPQVTADAVAVWQRLLEGDAAFTHDVGYRLKLELGSHAQLGAETVRVGALASNGVPPVAEAIVSKQTFERLRLDGSRSVLVSLVGGASPGDVARRLQAATGLRAEVLEDPRPRRAFLTGGAARKAFEPYAYIDNGDGMIQIDSGWVRRNIVSARVPIFNGTVMCHRLMIAQLRGALQEIQDRGLADLIDTSDYGGCWVPRHIDFNPSKPLSMHSWGLAIDFNVSTNGLGQVPQMDPRIVEVFDRWGFVWGGRWQRPDGMHFELGALLQSTGG